MNRIVLDASAILAILNQEAGAETLSPELLKEAAAGTVNLAEVQSKLVEQGLTAEDAWEAAISPVCEVVPFTAAHAKLAGSLTTKTRRQGLSLGDRACLALGLALDAPVYTADRSWKKIGVGADIRAIR